MKKCIDNFEAMYNISADYSSYLEDNEYVEINMYDLDIHPIAIEKFNRSKVEIFP